MQYIRNDAQFRRRMLRFLREAECFELVFVFGDSNSISLADCQIDTRVEIQNFGERREIIGALMKSLRQGEDIMRCFAPHHAIRASNETQTLEILICFKCTTLHALFIGEEQCFVAPFSKSALSLFNRFLPDYETKLAEHHQHLKEEWETLLASRIRDYHTEKEKQDTERAAFKEFWASHKL